MKRSEREKEVRRKYDQTEAGRESRKRCSKKYQQTEAGKESLKRCNKKYHQTRAGKESQNRGQKKYQKANPEKIKAANDVNHAIRDGKLVRPDNCESCFAEGLIEGHHEDYSKPFDVDWLCRKCHIELHRKVLV